jgi:stage V sporulation protein D (sporulation-specific penicillin-binding protein)
MVAVPQFSGKTLRAAAEQAMAAGLRLEAVGSGLARSQEPAPGTVLQAGAMVAVHFSR